MRRIRLSDSDRQKLFQEIEFSVNSASIASNLGISIRTLRDWKRGLYSMPEEVFLYLQKKYENIRFLTPFVIENSQAYSENGKKGARARYEKYGNPGTEIGRVKGGHQSVLVHQQKHTKFKILKQYPKIRKTAKFAEFIGIMLGDGGMTQYQARVTLHRHDDYDYAQHIKIICHALFGEYPTLSERRNVIEIVLSGKALVNTLNNFGLVIGNKIEQQISIPLWVYKKTQWIRSVLRGLFDTDGCVYQDKHKISGKNYSSICIAYTSYSLNLQRDICQLLQSLGLSPTLTTKNRIMLRKRGDVDKFFKSVQPHNIKHIIRYNRFLEE